MLTVGNNVLEKAARVEGLIECNKCGESHCIEYGEEILADGTLKKSKLLAFYKCGGKSYLAGINGKIIESL